MAQVPSAEKKARKVFGNVMFEEVENSLSYTPSPSFIKQVKVVNETSFSADPTPAPMVLFAAEKSTGNGNGGEDGVDDKENAPESTTFEKRSSTRKPQSSGSHVSIASDSKRKEELNRLRATAAQSPLKRDLVKKTQSAINIATVSVNKSLNTNKNKKTKVEVVKKERVAKSRKVRFQWKDECTEAKSFNEAAENSRRQFLSIKRDLSSKHFKAKSFQDQAMKKQHIQRKEKESHFKSEVFRDHQETLKAERDNKRRQSMEARAKIRTNHKEGEQRMKMIQIEEEAAIIEARHDSSKAHREMIKQNADQRRKSFAFRGGDSRRIRELRGKWTQDHQDQEHSNFELQQQAARDAEKYKKDMEKARRESLAMRNIEARRIRQDEKERATAAMVAEHESYELKLAGEKDAEEYQKRAREERRKSLANRNKESARHAKVMTELRTLAKEQEAESFVLKWAGEADAKAYLEKIAADRRKSLQLRGDEKKRQRKYDNDEQTKSLGEAVAEGTLQSECQKDVDEYKKQMAEKRRKSLAFRGKESTVHRMEADSQRQKQIEVEHQNFELDSLAQVDVEEYIKNCKQRRRLSLAFRAKEKRHHAEWERRENERQIEERSRDANDRAMDRRYVQLAEQKERARLAVDALRDLGCSFKGNPFADLFEM